MSLKPEIDAVNLVVRGSLNPSIFQPSWLASHNLIREEEVEAVSNLIITADIAQYTVAEWLNLTVVRDRFQATTTQQPYIETLRDLVVGVFRLLNNTPIALMGINREYHFKLHSEEVWHGLGYHLVPKKEWNEILEQPGMRRIDVEGLRPDTYQGFVKVRVEPSRRLEHGLFVEVNDHYVFQTDESESASDQLREILTKNWKSSMKRADKIAKHLSDLSETL